MLSNGNLRVVWLAFCIFSSIGWLLLSISINGYAFPLENVLQLKIRDFLPRMLKGKYTPSAYPALFGQGHPYDYYGSYQPFFQPQIPPPPPPPFLPPFPVPPPPPPPPPSDVEVTLPVSNTPEYIEKKVVVTATADLTCPETFSLNGRDCIKIDQKQSKLGCLEGWKFDDGVCKGVDVVPTSLSCDDGFFLKNEECLRILTAPRQIVCPPGYSLGEAECIKNVYTAAEWTCPTNYYRRDGLQCMKPERVTPKRVCPSQYTLSGEFCRRKMSMPASSVCANGFRSVGDNCEKQLDLDPTQTCASGYVLVDNKCTKYKNIQGTTVCSAGIVKDGRCMERFSTPAKEECPGGYSMDSNRRCNNVERVVAQKYCEKGTKYYAKTGMCHGKKHSQSPPTFQCSPGYNLQEGSVCVKSSSQPALLRCPPKHQLDQFLKLCYVEKFSPAHIKCPFEYTLNPETQICEAAETISVQLACKVGYTFDTLQNRCTKILFEKSSLQCADSTYSLNSNGICEKYSAVEPETQCPPGFNLESIGAKHFVSNRLKHFHSKSGEKTEQMCVGSQTVPAIPTCPSDFEVRKLSAESSGDAYPTEWQRTAKLFSGRKDAFSGFNSDFSVRCIGRQTEIPQFLCPSEFLDKRGICTKQEEGKPRTLCPEEYTLAAGQCVRSLEQRPVTMCPIGYKFIEGVCVKELYTRPSPLCPSGFKYDALVGECFLITIDYDFADKGPMPATPPPAPQEALLSLEETTTTTTTTEPPIPLEIALPEEVAAPVLPPSTVQIVQQPVPLPSPVVYLPAQAPIPPPPPPPPPRPIPVPYPVYINKGKHKKK